MSGGFYYPEGPRRRRKPPRKPPPPPPRGPSRRPPPLIPPMEPHDNPKYRENYNDWYVFHTKNPNLYDLICDHAEEAMAVGHTKYGMGAIFELIVWHYAVRVANPDLKFKMPHNHRAFYARMWVKNNPAYPKFLQLNEQPSRWLEKPKTDKHGLPI